MYNKNMMLALFVGSLILSGCGGSDSSSDDNSNSNSTTTKKGYLVDSAISGVSYSCGDIQGITSSTGEFECSSFPVTFNVGAYELGTIQELTSDAQIYPQDLLGVPRSSFTGDDLTELTQLLQSLDSDGNPSNGITISSETTKALADAQQNMTLEELASLAGVTVTDKDEAIAHLKEQIEGKINSNGGDVDLDSIDLSEYSAIYVYKNATAQVIDLFKSANKNNGDFSISDEVIECSSLKGYKELPTANNLPTTDTTFELNVNVAFYAKLPSFQSFCIEADYSNSQNTGNQSATMYWNQ